MAQKIPIRFVERKEDSDTPKIPIGDVVPPQNREDTTSQKDNDPLEVHRAAYSTKHIQESGEQKSAANNRLWWKEVVEIMTLVGILGTLIVTCQQNEIMRETFRLDKRAWIGVSGTKPLGEMIPGEHFRVRVKFKNVGSSPGLYVETAAYFSPVIKARDVKRVPLRDLSVLPPCMLPKPQWNERTTGSFVLPGKEHVGINQPTADPMNETTIKFVKGREADEPVISPEEWQQFSWSMGVRPNDPTKKKTVGLYLVGCINYFDEFKVPHRTNFCFRYEHATEEKDRFFSLCKDGHDAD